MPAHKLDDLDRKILQNLQSDGRMTLADLATKVGLSPSPCLRRVRMLEQSGVIVPPGAHPAREAAASRSMRAFAGNQPGSGPAS